MGRMASKQGWLHLGEVTFIRGKTNIKQLKSKLQLNQVLLATVTKVNSVRQAQVNLRGVEVLCDTPHALKAGSRIYVQVKELEPQVVLKLISLRENNPFWQQLEKEEISDLLKSFNLPQSDENSLIANELFKNGLMLSPESILEIKHDLASLFQQGIIKKDAKGETDFAQIIRLLVFLRSRGIAPSAKTISLAQKAFQLDKNLPVLLQALMGKKGAQFQSVTERLSDLLLRLPNEQLVSELARQVADLGWFYERKLRRGLDKQNVEFTNDVKHLLGKLAAGSKNPGLIQELWDILTARTLRNLPLRNLPQSEIYFPILFYENEKLQQAHLRISFSPESDPEETNRKKAKSFCLAFLLELSALGPLQVIAEVKSDKEVYLDFQVASATIKKMVNGQAKKLETALKAHGFAVKRWHCMVKNVSVDEFLDGTLSSRMQRWGKKIDVLV